MTAGAGERQIVTQKLPVESSERHRIGSTAAMIVTAMIFGLTYNLSDKVSGSCRVLQNPSNPSHCIA